jgi:RNA polymerase sigma factor for flagellar operon FliA
LIVTLYYYEGMTLKEIGQTLQLTESRISQLLSKSILALRKKLDYIRIEI